MVVVEGVSAVVVDDVEDDGCLDVRGKNEDNVQKCPKYKMWRAQNRWLKRLGRIGSNFRWEALRRILSGALRRFLNFVLGAEILGIFMLILGPLEGPKIPLNGLQKAPYLGF